MWCASDEGGRWCRNVFHNLDGWRDGASQRPASKHLYEDENLIARTDNHSDRTRSISVKERRTACNNDYVLTAVLVRPENRLWRGSGRLSPKKIIWRRRSTIFGLPFMLHEKFMLFGKKHESYYRFILFLH